MSMILSNLFPQIVTYLSQKPLHSIDLIPDQQSHMTAVHSQE